VGSERCISDRPQPAARALHRRHETAVVDELSADRRDPASQEIRAALEEMHAWSPASPLLLLGVSLGGALVLKMAGEAADRAPQLKKLRKIEPADASRALARITDAQKIARTNVSPALVAEMVRMHLSSLAS